MNSTEIKKTVRQFRDKYGLKEVTARSLARTFEQLGYTVIEFNPVVNDPDVTVLIGALGLTEQIAHSNGFLWTDRNYRLVFINEKLSEEEKKLVLSHEKGHAACGHMNHVSVLGQDVSEEFEANEFAHFLLRRTGRERVRDFVLRYRLGLLLAGVLLILVVCGIVVSRELRDRALYEGEYYVTATGFKFHRKGCIAIEGAKVRRLSKRDVEAGLYEPCSLCVPELQKE